MVWGMAYRTGVIQPQAESLERPTERGNTVRTNPPAAGTSGKAWREEP